MPAGRPVKYTKPEQMQVIIDEYFREREEKGLPFTITGLALALDMTREGLCFYAEKEEFADTIKKAKLRVEGYAEDSVYTSRNPAGAIFVLKNFGWSDTQKLELTGADGGPVEVEVSSAELARRARELIGD